MHDKVSLFPENHSLSLVLGSDSTSVDDGMPTHYSKDKMMPNIWIFGNGWGLPAFHAFFFPSRCLKSWIQSLCVQYIMEERFNLRKKNTGIFIILKSKPPHLQAGIFICWERQGLWQRYGLGRWLSWEVLATQALGIQVQTPSYYVISQVWRACSYSTSS